MSVLDLPMSDDGTDIDFANDSTVTGIDEYRQAVLLRLSHAFTFDRSTDGSPIPFGIDLMAELGTVGGDASLGVRASAAIQNDERFTAQLLGTPGRRVVNGVIELSLSFEVIVDETGETFSLDVLVANGEVRLVP
jgi:hypothetical protein